MRFLLTLLFLPFTIAISILNGIFKGVWGAKNLKYIPQIIQRVAEDSSVRGTVFHEIKFPQVLGYAEENGTIIHKNLNDFKFLINISNIVYSVDVTRALDNSNCAVFRSKKTNTHEISATQTEISEEVLRLVGERRKMSAEKLRRALQSIEEREEEGDG